MSTQEPDPRVHIPLINCIMAADFPPASAALCLETLGVTTTSPEEVPASYIYYITSSYMSQILYAGQSAREDVPFLSDF